MPVKWTPENDQLLLLKILETHDLSVDTKKVAEAWPGTDPGSKPTPRAISERLVRMRQLVKAGSGSGHFSISGKSSGKSSANVTPCKPRTAGNKSTTGTPTSGKRKRNETPQTSVKTEAANSDGGDTEMEDNSPTKKEQPGAFKRGHVKKESNDSEITLPDVNAIEATPSKRVRTPTARPGMVVYQSEGETKSYESSMDEYVPEGSVGQENEYVKDLEDEIDAATWV